MKRITYFLKAYPEFLLIVLTIFYWFSTSTLLNPIAIGLIVLLIVQFLIRSDYLGVIIPTGIILASIFLIFALFSEFSDFGEKSAEAYRLLIVGFVFIVSTIASSVLMIRKYTKG